MKIKKFDKINENISKDNIIKKTQNDYYRLLKIIKDYLLLKNHIKYTDYRIIDINWYIDGDDTDTVEFEMIDRHGDAAITSLRSDDFNDLLKYIENPELYKSTNTYNL